MPRRNVTAERQEQILDGFEHCIKIKGLSNTTLEDITDQAGIKRPALRHFIGNREQIVILLAQRIVDQAIKRTQSFDAVLEADGKTPHKAALSLLIKAMETEPAKVMTIHQLFALSSTDPKIKKLMQSWFDIYVKWLSKTMASFYREPKATLEKAACGIVMTCIAHGAISPVCSPRMNQLISGSIDHALNRLTPK